jgi:hypothetical protein
MTAWTTPPPHSTGDDAPLTRAECEEAIANVLATARSKPLVQRPKFHQQINDLLDARDTAILEAAIAECSAD